MGCTLESKVLLDLEQMRKKLSAYVNRGCLVNEQRIESEPHVSLKPDAMKIRPLRRVKTSDATFVAVDCSTRTLKRANNWGIYVMRVAHALIKRRDVDWGFEERICTVVGDSRTRSNFLTDFRIELESQAALRLLRKMEKESCYEHLDARSMYLLLDGGGYFGGERKFRVALYEKCEKRNIALLAVSKNSAVLHDEKGRDLIAATSSLSPYEVWFYHPVKKANKNQSLYGDISIVKLCKDSPRAFRCDIMEYLTSRELASLLSPLTSISEDPRCSGYPVVLWLAHQFSRIAESKLLEYHDMIEEELRETGLLEILRREEIACNFVDELHGVRYAFDRKWIRYV